MYCILHVCLSAQNASSDVDKMILGNKCDLAESRVVSTEKGKLVGMGMSMYSGNGNGGLGVLELSTGILRSECFVKYPSLSPSV